MKHKMIKIFFFWVCLSGFIPSIVALSYAQEDYCMAVHKDHFSIDIPQAGRYRIHYELQSGWNDDLIVRTNRPAKFWIGKESNDELVSVRLYSVLINKNAFGRIIDNGITLFFAPGDSGNWKDVASSDKKGGEIVLMDDMELKVPFCSDSYTVICRPCKACICPACPPCKCPVIATAPTAQVTEKVIEKPSQATENYDANSLPCLNDNGDGTVTDTRTGLVWLKNAKCFMVTTTYSGAVKWVSKLASGECGLADGSTAGQWRLPTVKELTTLISYKCIRPALLVGHPFTNVPDGLYWTSTPYAPDPSGAVTVNISNGFVLAMDQSRLCYTWPVRSGKNISATPPH